MAKNKVDFRVVILAGGSGERFWPLSTAERPKQFLRVFGDDSLLRQSVQRLGDLAKPSDTYVITAAKLKALTQRELPKIPTANIIGEPMRRDTGAAIALGVGVAAKVGKTAKGNVDDPVIGFFPSDQLVTKTLAFRAVVKRAIAVASERSVIVTLGIKPTHPSTSFGYIDPARGLFVEKPNADRAKIYMLRGYLWNAGMFIARASVFRAAFASHAQVLSVLTNLKTSITAAKLQTIYEALPRISFDYAVMEHYGNVCVIPADIGWDDVGGYSAFDAHFPHDKHGNVLRGDARGVEASNNICIANDARITVLGVDGLVVVAHGKDVLVVPKSRTGELKKLFE